MPMEGKLGLVMFQFEYLNKKKMPLEEAIPEQFDGFLGQIPNGYDFAVETRNPNYLNENFFDFLKVREVGFVLLEGYYMPRIADIVTENDVHTSTFTVIQLHGPDRQEIENQTGGVWNNIVAPKGDGLKTTASIIKENTLKGIKTFVNVNNHYE